METFIKIENKEVDWVLILTFEWELDETNADNTFKNIYTKIWDFAKRKVVFNFSKLKYLNSKATWYIALYYSHIDEFWWKMYIAECNETITNILDVVWITKVTDLIATEQEAIEIAKKDIL